MVPPADAGAPTRPPAGRPRAAPAEVRAGRKPSRAPVQRAVEARAEPLLRRGAPAPAPAQTRRVGSASAGPGLQSWPSWPAVAAGVSRRWGEALPGAESRGALLPSEDKALGIEPRLQRRLSPGERTQPGLLGFRGDLSCGCGSSLREGTRGHCAQTSLCPWAAVSLLQCHGERGEPRRSGWSLLMWTFQDFGGQTGRSLGEGTQRPACPRQLWAFPVAWQQACLPWRTGCQVVGEGRTTCPAAVCHRRGWSPHLADQPPAKPTARTVLLAPATGGQRPASAACPWRLSGEVSLAAQFSGATSMQGARHGVCVWGGVCTGHARQEPPGSQVRGP
ncbi:uncharacterized protein LOC116578877 [Mustela erminea]|uniref:uncharacterized protein LOC116578877 n=1 Tax=Mustela erminea TaxID=36723 RepID=UPI0013867A7F|nr:uncharacterized protein LOC116578877 [Mustela erminea]